MVSRSPFVCDTLSVIWGAVHSGRRSRRQRPTTPTHFWHSIAKLKQRCCTLVPRGFSRGDTVRLQGGPMNRFLSELKEQRWDDHRFYHHSRVNQSLHLVSACSFLVTYVLLFTQPVYAALFGWTFAMCIRQVGHFFFEPKGY